MNVSANDKVLDPHKILTYLINYKDFSVKNLQRLSP